MSLRSELEEEPWRFDFLNLLRHLERSNPDKPRIGDSSSRSEEFVALGQDPFMDFPASTVGRVDHDAQGRLRLFTKFLGLLGPQGALPVSTTEEAYHWSFRGDDAFPRFLDLLNHRFLQLFFRAWADARPIAQHDRPESDRFHTYLGSMLGIGSKTFADLDSVADISKLAFAGLLVPQVKSASRLTSFISGLFGVKVEIDQFVGNYVAIDEGERTLAGKRNSALGRDMLVGSGVYSVEDKIRIRIYVKDLTEFEKYLPTGRLSEQLTDAVFFYLGDEFDWDVELALPAGKIEPSRLGAAGRLGWTSWMAPNWAAADVTYRTDARFHPANRRRAKQRQEKPAG